MNDANANDEGQQQPHQQQQRTYPFEVVVVTFPDEGAARVASEGPLRDLQSIYPETKFLATCDPLGCRCGSGGGTLAALEQVEQEFANSGQHSLEDVRQQNILILHAGGDSSRCFTQMALGKAWTSLPLWDDTTGTPIWSNPIHLIMDSIARIFSQSHTLPQGSIVIAASDALLSIPHYFKPTVKDGEEEEEAVELGSSQHSDKNHPMPDVLGVAFPAPWETAKNHGVYVLSDPSNIIIESCCDDNNNLSPQHCRELQIPIVKVMQKPTMELLQQQPFVTFGNIQHTEQMAWIDNGIIAFLPRAANALYELAHGVLKTTTKTGLLQAVEERHNHKSNDNNNEEHQLTYQDVTHKVDLYTHFLQALTIVGCDAQETANKEAHKERYLRDHASDLEETVARGIFETLSPFQFQSLAIPEGKFLHLGTTRELLDFYVYGCMRPKDATNNTNTTHNINNNNNNNNSHTDSRHELYTNNCAYFGQELGMIRRLDVFVTWSKDQYADATNGKETGKPPLHIEKNCVLMACVLEATGSSHIGEGSVIEFCCLEKDQQSNQPVEVKIGKNCLVSGFRRLTESPVDKIVDYSMEVPDGACVQMMPLLKDGFSSNEAAQSFVYMALGVNDPIKKPISESTFFGVEMERFLGWANLSADDLWEPSASRTLWNAQLHPVVSSSSGLSFQELWGWLNMLPMSIDANSFSESAQVSLQKWKNQPRLSLNQVRDHSDAAGEFRYRHFLVKKIIPDRRKEFCERITAILQQRCNDECDFYPLLADALDLDNEDVSLGFMSPQANQALHTLDRVIQNCLLDQKKYDICGRTVMVESALFADLATAMFKDSFSETGKSLLASEIQRQCSSCLQVIQSPLSSGADRANAYREIVSLREDYLKSKSGSPCEVSLILQEFSDILEHIARMMTEICVAGFLSDNTKIGATNQRKPAVLGTWVVATAPARVDLAGGWSDTPPVCYEYGSTVTGMAVTVDRKMPLSCRCRIVPMRDANQETDNGVIFMRSELRHSQTCELTSAMDLKLRTLSDLCDARDPTASCALMKCALLCLGLMPLGLLHEKTENATLQSYVDAFCQSKEGEHVRMEIVITSLLPQGSGMGTSSILGGCVLAAVGLCVGVEHSSLAHYGSDAGSNSPNDNDIIDSVSALEQILSTGGGFQDQVNGLIGGIKTVSSKANQLPIHLTIERVQIEPDVQQKLDGRLLLAFSGKTRLAKNILQNVLRRWARRTPEVVNTVKSLVEGARKAREALQKGDLETLGECLHNYYAQKRNMAGEDSGVEPEIVRIILDLLKRENLISGASLCGAGGGGFLVMIAAPTADKASIHSRVDQCLAANPGHDDYSWHECHISDEGLSTKVLTDQDTYCATDFDESWLGS